MQRSGQIQAEYEKKSLYDLLERDFVGIIKCYTLRRLFFVISGGDVENDKCEAKATMPLTEMNFSHIYPQGSICFAAAAVAQ